MHSIDYGDDDEARKDEEYVAHSISGTAAAFQARLEKIHITLRSPDGSIYLSGGIGDKPFQVAFEERRFNDHSAHSLEKQLSALLRAGVHARNVAYQSAWNTTLTKRDETLGESE